LNWLLQYIGETNRSQTEKASWKSFKSLLAGNNEKKSICHDFFFNSFDVKQK